MLSGIGGPASPGGRDRDSILLPESAGSNLKWTLGYSAGDSVREIPCGRFSAGRRCRDTAPSRDACAGDSGTRHRLVMLASNPRRRCRFLVFRGDEQIVAKGLQHVLRKDCLPRDPPCLFFLVCQKGVGHLWIGRSLGCDQATK